LKRIIGATANPFDIARHMQRLDVSDRGDQDFRTSKSLIF
jgi:hypothetical protein